MTKQIRKKVIEPGFWRTEYDESGNTTGIEYYESFRKLVGLNEKDLGNTNEAWFNRIHPRRPTPA